MKIALGIGNLAARGRYGTNAYIKGFNHIKEAILNKNSNVDVFLHSYEPEIKDDLLKMYNPIDYIFENQVDFKEIYQNLNPLYCSYGNATTMSYQNLFSMTYSRNSVNNLISNYEDTNKFKYNWIIYVRYDITSANHIEPIFFDKNLNNEYVYLPMFEQMNIGPQDQWFYSKSDNMHIILSLYKNLITYLSDNSEYIQNAINGWINSNNIDFKSNELLNLTPNVINEKLKINVLTNAHLLYKWHLYKNDLWTLKKLKFIAQRPFKEELHKSIIQICKNNLI